MDAPAEAPDEAPDDVAAAGFDAVVDEPESDDFESEDDDEVDEAADVEGLVVERESVR